jgi:hypothetical protein
MKSFYHKKFDSYLDPARELDVEVTDLVRPIFERYVKLKYPPHEIEQIMHNAISMLTCSIVMERNRKSIIKKENKAGPVKNAGEGEEGGKERDVSI